MNGSAVVSAVAAAVLLWLWPRWANFRGYIGDLLCCVSGGAVGVRIGGVLVDCVCGALFVWRGGGRLVC